mmetsp:Transcript_10949/g.26514  ORF Transcript_10949/g.26514 Transcript_10949/m.26514 type:complete len:292 (+) Transcript_10949:1415-2290(+)
MSNRVGNNRVALVVGVTTNVVSHPGCWCDKLSIGTTLNKVQVLRQLCQCDSIAVDVVQVCSHQGDQAWKVITLARHDFTHGHFFISILFIVFIRIGSRFSLLAYTIGIKIFFRDVIIDFAGDCLCKHGDILHPIPIISFVKRSHVTAEKELALGSSVSAVCALHVCIHFADRNVQVQIECQNDTLEQYNKDREGGILEIGELHLHTSEFRSPSNVWVIWTVARRWWLPSNSLPICTLDTLKVLCLNLVIDFFDGSIKDHEWVSDKQVCNMLGKSWIDSSISHILVLFLVNW